MPVTLGNSTAYDLQQFIRAAEHAGTSPAISYTKAVNSTPLTSTTEKITSASNNAAKPKKLTLGKLIGTAFRAMISYPFAKMAASVFRGVSGAKHIQLGAKKIPLNFNFKQYLAALLALKTINTVSHNAGLNLQA